MKKRMKVNNLKFSVAENVLLEGTTMSIIGNHRDTALKQIFMSEVCYHC